MGQNIVVWDPAGGLAEGSLVTDEMAHKLRSAGTELLPVMPPLFRQHALGGYMRRGWGAGWPLDHSAPRLNCPMAIFVPSVFGERGQLEPVRDAKVHWCARIEPDPKEKTFAGILRFVIDPSQPTARYTGFTKESESVEIGKLGPVDTRGGWTVRGNAAFRPQTEGVYAFAFYAAAPGLRVTWAAISLTTATG